jgi:hypothetical protein
MGLPVLTPDEVRAYLSDYAENNHLLDAQEFSDMQIGLAISLAVSDWNMAPPLSADTMYTVDQRFKSVFLSGTLYKLFAGASALLARNTLEYSDGGVTVPVEERMQLYTTLAGMYQADFQNAVKSVKIHLNMESGWDCVSSDYANFPIW